MDCRSRSVEVEIVVLEECDPDLSMERECHWINYYVSMGHRLTNAKQASKSYITDVSKRRDSVLEAISDIPNKELTTPDIVAHIRRLSVIAGGQKNLAEILGVSPTQVNDPLTGRREPETRILTALGLRRVVTFEFINQ